MTKTLVAVACLGLFSFACRSSHPSDTHAEVAAPSAEMQLWKQYVDLEVSAGAPASECLPRIIRADAAVERKGLLMFFHGFTECPQQFSVLAEKLGREGFDVYLPLLPGHGRKGGTSPAASADRYRKFMEQMNAIARLAPRGDRVLAGISGGGGLAMETARLGRDIWDRILVYAPRRDESLPSAGMIQVPLQLVGVDGQDATEAAALRAAVKGLKNARMCLYPEGMPGAMLAGTVEGSAAEAYWTPAMQEASVAFISRGRWFLTSGITPKSDGLPTCRYTL